MTQRRKPTDETPEDASEEQAAPAAPVQISVQDFAAAQAPIVGHETAVAFLRLYPTHTATITELEHALMVFRTKPV